MSDLVYYMITSGLTVLVLVGIALMGKVKMAKAGNLLSAFCMLLAILLTLYKYEVVDDIAIWAAMATGTVLGLFLAYRVKMIQMPQAVALLNGFGGAASAIVGLMETIKPSIVSAFSSGAAGLAMVVGMLTLTGSLIAAFKLHGIMNQKPIVVKGHAIWTAGSMILALLTVGWLTVNASQLWLALPCLLFSGFFGIMFAIRVGGADMPITISLLNSFSGVAAGIAGISIADPLLVAVGGIVGSSGLLLTQIMCKAMNRHLADILLGKTSIAHLAQPDNEADSKEITPEDIQALAGMLKNVVARTVEPSEELGEEIDPIDCLRNARRVIIVPGYGMALSQAQTQVKRLAEALESLGITVQYAIHPVAGRMPGHMNVLLAEVDVPYDQLFEMDDINPEFAECDVCVVVGANDVINPAANTAIGTPIYGMPVLSVERARHLILCNFDTKPGYAGVDNPLYVRSASTTLMLGDAKDSLEELLTRLR